MVEGCIELKLGNKNTKYVIEYTINNDVFDDAENSIDIINMRYSHSGTMLPFDRFMKILSNYYDEIKSKILDNSKHLFRKQLNNTSYIW